MNFCAIVDKASNVHDDLSEELEGRRDNKYHNAE